MLYTRDDTEEMNAFATRKLRAGILAWVVFILLICWFGFLHCASVADCSDWCSTENITDVLESGWMRIIEASRLDHFSN